MHGYEHSISLKIPPLSVMYFKHVPEKKKAAKKADGEKKPAAKKAPAKKAADKKPAAKKAPAKKTAEETKK